MGEIAVNSAVEVELQYQKKKNNLDITEGGGALAPAAVDSSIMNWERFLPKMVRVMLVEADDSTRQIIAALLRKCSYKVAAVSDGLKAWELLKGKPCGVDLILTEVELPSISGYALLSLIMEDDACKHIPVIMMSSQDSMSTVYKCMLRGAADFLVKPVRKNELRNLWQHVWRKQTSSSGAGLGPPDMNVTGEKDEATDENNAVSNHSSGYMSSGQRNKQCIEKGSDTQSSCTNPEMEIEAEVEHDHCISVLKTAKFLADGNNISTCEEHYQESRKRRACDDENGESQITGRIGVEHTTKRSVKNPDDTITKNSCVLENSFKEAIDLIGTFDNHRNSSFSNSAPNGVINKFNTSPPLDLSLRRSYPDGSSNQANIERPQLNHSDASPFSKYVNKALQLCNSKLPFSINNYQDRETNSMEQSSKHIPEFHSVTSIQTGSPKEISVATGHTQQHEITFSNTRDKEISHPIPVRGVRFDISACNSVMPSLYSAKSGSPGQPSPGTTRHSEPFPQLNAFCSSVRQPSPDQQFHNLVDQKHSISIDETENKHGDKLDDQKHASPGKGQSNDSSSYCNGNMSHNHNTGSGSNGTMSTVMTPSECVNEESLPVHEGSSHRSLQREAALTKFRLKRKDRCFEKKVRYESRKKLAEQRPRVKGQFVRQVPNDPKPGNSSDSIRS